MNLNNLYLSFGRLLGATPLHPQFLAKRFVEKQIEIHAPQIKGLVLDLGCGHAPYRKYFSQADYLGFDHPGPSVLVSPAPIRGPVSPHHRDSLGLPLTARDQGASGSSALRVTSRYPWERTRVMTCPRASASRVEPS